MKSFPFKLKISALDRFSSTFANASTKIDRLGKKARGLGNSLTLGLSLPLATFGSLAVKKAADMETLRTALETATGSADAAKVAWGNLTDFASTTPFALEEVVDSFIKLKNLGLDPSNEALTSYGNTAGAMGKSLNQMIEAVADAATGEFERLKEFGIKASSQGNKVTFTFRGVKTTVRKDAAEITKYLQSLGNVQFAGGMEKQAQTINGAFSNLGDSVNIAMDKVGTSIAKSLDLNTKVRAFGDTINNLADKFDRLPEPVKKFASWAGVAAIAVGPLLSGVGQLVITMGVIVALAPKIAAGFAAITAAAPWLLLVGLVAGIGYQFYKLVEQAGGVGRALSLIGTTVLDALVAPLRIAATIISKIWGLFGSPPKLLTRVANGSMTRDLADFYHNEDNQKAAASARAYFKNSRDIYELNQRAMKGDKAAIEILFKNPPEGMRTNISQDSNADVSIDQGVPMGGVY